MATKGTLLSTLLDPALVLGGIDSNRLKQGRFAAGSGVAIHDAAWLATLAAPPHVIAMNPNYLDEIKAAALAVRPDAMVEAI